MSSHTAIYALVDPETKRVRYVGRSARPERRFAAHLSEVKTYRRPKDRWIRDLLDRGLKPALVILEELEGHLSSYGMTGDTRHIAHAERRWIRRLLEAGHPLTNADTHTQLHRDHIGRIERGEAGNSRPPTVRHLAEALGVDPRELLAED